MTQYGFNFRASVAYVTDDAPCTRVVTEAPPDDYSITRNGITFGIETRPGDASRDRYSANDARFAGMNFCSTGETYVFRVDLPTAGDWTIRASFGDVDTDTGAPVAGVTIYALVKDDATTVATLDSTTGTGWYVDATGAPRMSITDWVNNNQPLTQTFASQILRIQLGNGTDKGGRITHLLLESPPPAAGGWLRYRK